MICRNHVCYVSKYVCMYMYMYVCMYVLNTDDLNHAHKTFSLSLHMYVCTRYIICMIVTYEIVLYLPRILHTYIHSHMLGLMVRGPPGPAAREDSTELLSIINERHRCRQAWWLVTEQSGSL